MLEYKISAIITEKLPLKKTYNSITKLKIYIQEKEGILRYGVNFEGSGY